MSLVDDLTSTAPAKRTKPCTFTTWVNSLTAEEQAAVRAAISRPRSDPTYWPTPQLHQRLVDAGWKGSEATIYNHRAGTCLTCR